MSNRDLEIMADERLQAETVALREQVRKLETALQSEQRARWAAEQDAAHYKERCEALEAVAVAARRYTKTSFSSARSELIQALGELDK